MSSPLAPLRIEISELSNPHALGEHYVYGVCSVRLANAIHSGYGHEFDFKARTRPIRPSDWFVLLLRPSDGRLCGYACLTAEPAGAHPTTLGAVLILAPFRRLGLGSRFIQALLDTYSLQYVEAPSEQVRSIMRALGRTGPILFYLPAEFIGLPNSQYLPLLLPFQDYPAFLSEFHAWRKRLDHLIRLYGSLEALKRLPEGALALQEMALSVLEYVDLRGYALGKKPFVQEARARAFRAVQSLSHAQARRGIVWDIR